MALQQLCVLAAGVLHPAIGMSPRVARAISSATVASLARRCFSKAHTIDPSIERIEHYGEECEFLPQPQVM
jgi:hypothetical protein